MMRFQSLLMESGTTGWMLAVYFIASAGPMPKSQLFWIGTLMRAATGFWTLGRFGFLGLRVLVRLPAQRRSGVGERQPTGERAENEFWLHGVFLLITVHCLICAFRCWRDGFGDGLEQQFAGKWFTEVGHATEERWPEPGYPPRHER